MSDTAGPVAPLLPPVWALRTKKPWWQHCYDLAGAPLRMVVLPDHYAEKLHLTSLRAERFSRVLPESRGRVLDIGAGDNALIRLYRGCARELGVKQACADSSVGVDVVDWGGGCQLIESSAKLPFADATFDTVTYIACLNHIPERAEALVEARRILRPGGRVVITMIGRTLGRIGHALWWYSEDKHRHVDENEEMGLDQQEVIQLFDSAGFRAVKIARFVYRLNCLYVFEPI